jgi:hypothetical protein
LVFSFSTANTRKIDPAGGIHPAKFETLSTNNELVSCKKNAKSPGFGAMSVLILGF